MPGLPGPDSSRNQPAKPVSAPPGLDPTLDGVETPPLDIKGILPPPPPEGLVRPLRDVPVKTAEGEVEPPIDLDPELENEVQPSKSLEGIPMPSGKPLQIRNSTAEFLIFTKQAGESSIEVRVEGETVWLSQKQMASLFEASVQTVNQHLLNLYDQGEITKAATIKNFLIVQNEGTRKVSRSVEFCNLDAIIAVGFRVNSERAIQFRQWAGGVIRDFAVKGYVLDKERLKNGAFLTQDYFDHLLEEIREIRASERKFYQKITDIYATAMDYNRDAETTHAFFATVQNRLHFAIHGHTAAELIVDRADSIKEHMGLTTWRNAPHGKVLKPDVIVAKNYLTKEEMDALDRIVSMYLEYAESQTKRHIPMTMADWSTRLNAFLQFNERDILSGSGKVTQEIAKSFAESEFEKYRVVQDRLFESDFDRQIRGELEGGLPFDDQ